MTKTEACKILQVASTADAEIVTQAYWHLARKYRAEAPKNNRAQDRLAELDKAFAALHPSAGGPPPIESRKPPGVSDPAIGDELTAWLRTVIAQTKARWPGRSTEIAVLAVATGLLAFLALSAGANAVYTIVAAGVALITIWAPWRKT